MKIFQLSLICLLLLFHGVLTGEDKAETIADLVCFWDLGSGQNGTALSA